MKKFLQISIVILLILAITVTALAFSVTRPSVAGKLNCPNVGWNSKGISCYAVGTQTSPGGWEMVGWNS
jgi:hypothetical protein